MNAQYGDLLADIQLKAWRNCELTTAEKQQFLDAMDKVWPQENLKGSGTKIFFDANGRLTPESRGRQIWTPNPGIVGHVSRWDRNAHNGHYTTPTATCNFEFNDILVYAGATKGGRRGGVGKIIFRSSKFDVNLWMMLDRFTEVASRMIRGYLPGRWSFSATSKGLHLVPMEH